MIQENANPTDNANAYLRGLMNYYTKRCYSEAKLPYERSAQWSVLFASGMKLIYTGLLFSLFKIKNEAENERLALIA